MLDISLHVLKICSLSELKFLYLLCPFRCLKLLFSSLRMEKRFQPLDSRAWSRTRGWALTAHWWASFCFDWTEHLFILVGLDNFHQTCYTFEKKFCHLRDKIVYCWSITLHWSLKTSCYFNIFGLRHNLLHVSSVFLWWASTISTVLCEWSWWKKVDRWRIS